MLLGQAAAMLEKENKIITDNKDKFDYLVFHTELTGMTYANNRPIINGLQIDVCDDNCRILSGHIHKRQESKKGLYFGSPYQMDRSDIGDQKGIYIYTVGNDGVVTRSFVENMTGFDHSLDKRLNFSLTPFI